MVYTYAVAAALTGANTHDLAVNGARYAVVELQVHLGDRVLGVNASIANIT